MKIYFAGEPGGNKVEGEKRMLRGGVINRLCSFYYKKGALIVLKLYKNMEKEDDNK